MHVIPVMTDALGQHWPQPALERVLVDETHALLAAADFAKLLDYSGTLPTGVYAGKMWRRRSAGLWYLCWYGEPDEHGLYVHAREVLLA